LSKNVLIEFVLSFVKYLNQIEYNVIQQIEWYNINFISSSNSISVVMLSMPSQSTADYGFELRSGQT